MHILKLNIIAAITILLVKLLATVLKGRVSAKWKYVIWLLVTVSLLTPVQLPASFSLVDVKVQSYGAQGKESVPDRMEGHTEAATEKMQQMSGTNTAGQDNGQQIHPLQNGQDENVNGQRAFAVHTSGRWVQIAAGIFLAVWLIVAVLKLTGEFLAYYLSMRNLERMSLPVSDSVSIPTTAMAPGPMRTEIHIRNK